MTGKLIILFFTAFLTARNVLGQVEHNYPERSHNTNCDSIHSPGTDFNDGYDQLKSATWRFKQSIKLNRYEGIRRAEYYSCDGQTGFLIVLSEKNDCLYEIVPIAIWNDFLKTPDPEKYFNEKISEDFDSICRK
jgi:hypothetical protein